MDILDDACSSMIALIYIYLFWQYFSTEKRLMKIFGGGLRDNPMLRYKTQNGPITSPMGLIGLTQAQSFMPQAAYFTTPTGSCQTSTYDSPNSSARQSYRSKSSTIRTNVMKSYEEERRKAE